MRAEILECRKIAKKYGVKVLFQNLKGAIAGQADLEKETIVINSQLNSRQEILSTLFHELSHILCFRRGLWKSYHSQDEHMMKTAARAEKHIDKLALHLCYSYDKRLRYLGSYLDTDSKEIKDFLEDYYNGVINE